MKVRFTASGELQCCDEAELQSKSKSPRSPRVPQQQTQQKSPRSPRKESLVVSRIENLESKSVFEDDEYQ